MWATARPKREGRKMRERPEPACSVPDLAHLQQAFLRRKVVRRVIVPALTRCAVCKQLESEHAKDGHAFKLDTSIPSWHGWHAFRRGLATNLHTLGVDDKTIQAILRHSNVALTINVYIKSVTESQVSAMDVLEAKFSETSNNLPTGRNGLVN